MDDSRSIEAVTWLNIVADLCYYGFLSSWLCLVGSAKSNEEKALFLETVQNLKKHRDSIQNEGLKKHKKISVIIPCYNEEKSISAVIERALDDPNVEVIVSDGGSKDRTIEICHQYPVDIVAVGKNRSECLNHGASIATGDILLFLHADTMLPQKWGERVRSSLEGDL